jgi:prepilin-type N-terminal cleavage/methylation domain-containing protein
MTGNREGFSLMEVVISMVLLSVILTTLAGLTYAAAQQAVRTTNVTTRQAASLELANRFSTLPYDSLVHYSTAQCDSVGSTNDWYFRCVRATAGGNRSTVVITVKSLQRDTMTTSIRLVRMGNPPSNPLCISC